MSATTSPRKRCELACRPCRHRKIKCQTSILGGPCDSCRSKAKERECEYIPVSEDNPPPKPRQSPPATNHSYAPLTTITPTTDHGNMSPTGAPSPSYYGIYSQYNTAQQTSPHYSSPIQTTFASSHPHDYQQQYAQPSSTTQHFAPSSPTSSGYSDCPTGMTMPAGGVEITTLPPTWDPSQGRYVVNSYMPTPSDWAHTPAVLAPQHDNQSEMDYYNVDQSAAYQEPNQQYNASYYNSP